MLKLYDITKSKFTHFSSTVSQHDLQNYMSNTKCMSKTKLQHKLSFHTLLSVALSLHSLPMQYGWAHVKCCKQKFNSNLCSEKLVYCIRQKIYMRVLPVNFNA